MVGKDSPGTNQKKIENPIAFLFLYKMGKWVALTCSDMQLKVQKVDS